MLSFISTWSNYLVITAFNFAIVLMSAAIYYHLSNEPCHGQDVDDVVRSSAGIEDFYSSIWCWGSNHTHRRCRFTNLCYWSKTKDFVFFHGNKSVVHGVPEDRFNPALLDLSSVEDHNTQYFSYTEIPAEAARNFTIELIEGTAVVLNRFKPDNLMHVFHDDLLPLFFTLQEICSTNDVAGSTCAQTIQLVFSDDSPACQYYNLYKMLSNRPPILLSERAGRDSMLCLSDAYVGISKYTLWYQYGFRKPQGPLPTNMELVGREVQKFTKLLKHKFNICDLGGITPTCVHCEGLAVVLSRTDTRLIVNEDQLTTNISQLSKMKVRTLRLEEDSLKDIISTISEAQLLVGMHGAMMVLSMFLPPGSVVIELFPYAINPMHYTPYRTLATLPGLGIAYYSWQNTFPNNTRTHSNYPPEFGGINHLPLEEQERIILSSKVPQHLCCDDPEWMFRIYQDTIVDLPSFSSILLKALKARQDMKEKLLSSRFPDTTVRNLAPSQVTDLHCDKENSKLKIEWRPPWNLIYLKPRTVEYEIWIQPKDFDENVQAFIVRETQYIMQNISSNLEYLVWIRCHADRKAGPFNVYPLYCAA